MNKKIALSMLTIGVTLTMVTGATVAWFSDTETSSGNILSAGTIDIKVDGQNPQSNTYTQYLSDMKPSQVREITFTVKNVGGNPVRVWKHLGDFSTSTGIQTEPECDTDAENGSWDDGTKKCTGPTAENNNIQEVVTYDMYVSYDGGTNWEVLIDEDDMITMGDINSAWIDLAGSLTDKALPANGEIVVKQSYHIQDDAGNKYQGDTLTFNIDIYAQQTNAPELSSGTLLMENKDASWNVIKGDGMWGMLKFDETHDTFKFTFEARGLAASTNYSLIYYAEPWPGNYPGAHIATMGTDVNGDISTSGDVDLTLDLPAPADANYPTGAKIWLVPASDYNSGTKSVVGWNPTQYLYEYNLIKYDDTNY